MKHSLHSFVIFASVTCIVFAPLQLQAQPVAEPPSWARGTIWYLILPDRFANGDTENDPTAADVFDDPNTPWEVSRWTANWYTRTVKERMRHDRFRDAALLRWYGGDFDGIAGRLDYLQELGVTGIIFTPLFESLSPHKYDPSTLHHVDSRFGPRAQVDTVYLNREVPTDPRTWYFTSADRRFLDLVQEIHRRGMHVLLSAQFAHVGVHFWAFQDLLERQENSPYGSWFTVHSWDKPESPYTSEFTYDAMWGVDAFPKFQQDTLGLAPGPRDYVFASTRRWMDPDGNGDPSDGVDGWIIDLTNEIPLSFWKSWTQHARSINPRALLINQQNPVGGVFDAAEPDQFGDALYRFYLERSITATDFDRLLSAYRNTSTLTGVDALLTRVDSHESPRLSSVCANLHEGAKKYYNRSPEKDEWKLARNAILLQFTLPGSPVIYYGDEAGMWGGDDPDNRKPMRWPEMAFEPECSFEVDGDDTRTSVYFDSSMYDYYRTLLKLRTEHLALQAGSQQTLMIDDVAGLYAFERSSGADKVYVFINAGDNSSECTLSYVDLPDGVRLEDPINHVYFYVQDDHISFVMPPRGATILVPVGF